MIYEDSGCDGCPSVASDKKSITGRDRLTWRKDGVRLLLFHRSDQNPLAIIEPDAKYFRLYRIRYPDGHLSDMVNLTRAKDAACSFVLRSLNSPPQETPSLGSQARKKAEAEGETLAKAQIASSGLLVDCLQGGGREAAAQQLDSLVFPRTLEGRHNAQQSAQTGTQTKGSWPL